MPGGSGPARKGGIMAQLLNPPRSRPTIKDEVNPGEGFNPRRKVESTFRHMKKFIKKDKLTHVYIVCRGADYEGLDIIGIFATYELANSAAKNQMNIYNYKWGEKENSRFEKEWTWGTYFIYIEKWEIEGA